jgi:hypothetical protein
MTLLIYHCYQLKGLVKTKHKQHPSRMDGPTMTQFTRTPHALIPTNPIIPNTRDIICFTRIVFPSLMCHYDQLKSLVKTKHKIHPSRMDVPTMTRFTRTPHPLIPTNPIIPNTRDIIWFTRIV